MMMAKLALIAGNYSPKKLSPVNRSTLYIDICLLRLYCQRLIGLKNRYYLFELFIAVSRVAQQW